MQCCECRLSAALLDAAGVMKWTSQQVIRRTPRSKLSKQVQAEKDGAGGEQRQVEQGGARRDRRCKRGIQVQLDTARQQA